MDDEERAVQRASAEALGFGRLFEYARDPVIVADDRGRILLWNDAATAVFGWTYKEVVGQSVGLIVPPRLQDRHDAGMARFGASGRGPLVDERKTVELPAVRKDGEEIVVELTLTPLAEPRRLVMAIVRDVTERTRLREALKVERDELQEANRALEAFNFLVSHDLKEPVRALHSYLALAQQGEAEPRVKQRIERARAATEHMDTLLRGLLEWSRVARRPIEPVVLDVAQVVGGEAARAQYAHLVAERKAALEVDTQGLRVRATAPLLAQVVGNAVVNALKHYPSEGARVRVVARRTGDGFVDVTVEDDGNGFPPSVLEWFAPGQRQEMPSTKGGFGLLIARRAAERLGSPLVLLNRPGGGASVSVRLPEAA